MSYLPDDVRGSRPTGGTSGASGSPMDGDVEAEHRGLGRFVGLTTLGTVLPGSGLLLSGRRWFGGLLLATFVLAMAGIAAFVYWKGPTNAALYLGVRPRWLIGLSIALAAAVLVWCASIVYTAWINRPYPPSWAGRTLSSLWIALMCAALLVPTAVAAQYAVIQKDLLSSVFSTGKKTSGNSPDVAQEDPWASMPRVTVLLVGSDAYPDRPGVRTDSMMVASIDTTTGDTVLFGIPRNLQGYRFRPTNPLYRQYPNGPHCGLECMLTAVWEMAAAHRNEYVGDPNPSLSTLTEVISDLLGLQIDNTVVIDIRGFSALVDAMGGVDITVRSRLPIGGKIVNGYIVPGSINGWIEPGRQHMNGYTAMWFARSRVLADDFDRMKRQRCMVAALMHQVNPLTMVRRYPDLARVAQDNIQIDVPMSHLPAWADLASRIQRKGTIRSLPFTGNLISLNNPDYLKIHAMVQAALDPTTTTLPTATPSSSTSTSTPTRSTRTPTSTSSINPSGIPTPSQSTSAPDGLTNVADAC